MWDLSRFVQTLVYFESIPIFSTVQKMFAGSPPPPTPEAGVIFDFRNGSVPLQQIWGALDDVVMGGVSASSLYPEAQGALFSGVVSTANSGGFTSVRTRNFEPPLNLSQYRGLELRVKGDGNRYKFLIRDDNSWDSVAYAHTFDTSKGAWTTVQIPFATLVPVFRAKTVKNASPLKTDCIRSLQLMLSKFEYDGMLNPHFEPGAFGLLIQSIGVY
ncbi:MAG TPA: CIA30 family protein [Stenomitos sp.]